MHFQQQPVSAPWTAAEFNGDVTSALLCLFPCSSAQGFDGTGCCRVPSGGVCAVTFLCLLLFSMPSFIFFSPPTVHQGSNPQVHPWAACHCITVEFFLRQRRRTVRLNVPRPVVCATSSPFFAVGCTSAGTCLCMCCRAKKETTTKQTHSSFATPDKGLKVCRAFCALGLSTQRLSRQGVL